MSDIGGNACRTLCEQCFGSIAKRAAGIDDIVDQDAILPGHFADDVHHFGLTRAVAALVHDRQQTVKTFCQGAGAHDTADIGRDNHHVADIVIRLDIARQDRNRIEIVRGYIEEALDLSGMQVERQNTVGTSLGDQIGDQLGRDRRAPRGATILATEAVRLARNIRQVSIAPLIGEAMRRISEETSVSSLFD